MAQTPPAVCRPALSKRLSHVYHLGATHSRNDIFFNFLGFGNAMTVLGEDQLFCEHFLLDVAEALLALALEERTDRLADPLLDHAVGVGEVDRQPPRELAADGGLAGTGEADEGDGLRGRTPQPQLRDVQAPVPKGLVTPAGGTSSSEKSSEDPTTKKVVDLEDAVPDTTASAFSSISTHGA